VRVIRAWGQAAQAGALPVWRDRYLTFDDGPGPDTEALLDVLARHRVRATFFLTGERAAAGPAVVGRIRAEGHSLGNHSWDHSDLRTLSLHAVRSHLTRTSEAIERATGERPTVFRPPSGYTSRSVGALARGLGMWTLLWDVETYDWRDPGPDAIAAAIWSAPPATVLLLHDGPGARGQTVAGVERALKGTP
jgi:peptidoglycan/xylan/chitin deacetylase (PgdA/CDA1 family)